jgi:hypothetical protein
MSRFYLSRVSLRIGDNHDMDPKPATPPPLELDDYYLEGETLVFTAAYHLKRGSCCGSGCRHCPYQSEPSQQAAQSDRN